MSATTILAILMIISFIMSIILLVACIYVGFQAVKKSSTGLGWLCFALFVGVINTVPDTNWIVGENKPILNISIGEEVNDADSDVLVEESP